VIDAAALRWLLLVLTSWLERREREVVAYLVVENLWLSRSRDSRKSIRVQRPAMLDGPLRRAIVHQENSLQSNGFQPHNGEVRRGVSVGGTRRLRLCCDAVVAVMEAADFWNRDNTTG
jgi:hypothetical protein